VTPGSSRFGAPPAVALAVVLCGCAQLGLDTDQPLFRKQLDFGGQTGGYTFSDVQDSRRDRPITAGDLVDASGSCPAPPQQQQAPQPSNQAASPAAAPSAAPADGASLLGEGVALGMSECDVVYRAGAPSNVQLGQKPNGDRTAVLTFDDGPRAGIYHFEGGKLTEMDRTAAPPPPPQTAKKKPAKPKKQAKSSNAT
jgi:hypothetical protein